MSAAHDNRVFHYAVLLSILVHGLVLLSAPRLNPASKRVEVWPLPIAARLVQPAPTPEPVMPEPPAPKPEVSKPRPRPEPAPVAKAAAPEQAPAAPATAPEPVATPAPSAVEAPQAAAPAPRAGAQSDADSIARFRLQVIEAAARYKRYPRVAQDNAWQGRAGVRVSFGADGRRSSVTVVRSSGYEALDRQALETVNQAEVPVPAALRGKQFAFDFDVIFDLKEGS